MGPLHVARICGGRVGIAGVVLVLLASVEPAGAQSVREVVTGARLGSGYAQMLNLAATPDIAAARYEVDDGDEIPKLDLLRAAHEATLTTLSKDAEIRWKLSGGYLKYRADLNAPMPPTGTGVISSRWTAYSLSAGLLGRVRLGAGYTLVPAVDFGVSRLTNQAGYDQAAAVLKPFLDGLAFNWETSASLVTPSIGIEWQSERAGRRLLVRGRVARSWISSFDEPNSALRFNEAANVYSIRAERSAPTGMRILDSPVNWVAFGSFAGFFGANRDVLGVTSIGELGLAIEAPLLRRFGVTDDLRFGASILFGPQVRGWTIALSLRV